MPNWKVKGVISSFYVDSRPADEVGDDIVNVSQKEHVLMVLEIDIRDLNVFSGSIEGEFF